MLVEDDRRFALFRERVVFKAGLGIHKSDVPVFLEIFGSKLMQRYFQDSYHCLVFASSDNSAVDNARSDIKILLGNVTESHCGSQGIRIRIIMGQD